MVDPGAADLAGRSVAPVAAAHLRTVVLLRTADPDAVDPGGRLVAPVADVHHPRTADPDAAGWVAAGRGDSTGRPR
jgi:hypothetical protein